MWRPIALIVCIWIAATRTADAHDLTAIKQAGRLNVASAKDSPFEAAVLQGFARAIGVETNWIAVASSEVTVAAVAEGRADLAAGWLLSSKGPKDGFTFSAEVLPDRLVVVNRKPAAPLQFVEQLRGERVAAPRDTTAPETLAAAKVTRVEMSQDSQSALASLRAGVVTAVALPLSTALR